MPKSELSVYFLPINAKKPGKVVTGFFIFFTNLFTNYCTLTTSSSNSKFDSKRLWYSSSEMPSL